jgi:hypothetical protein
MARQFMVPYSGTFCLIHVATEEKAMTYEVPMYRFKSDVSFEKAKETTLKLNQFLETAPGFIARKTIYDKAHDIWIDFVEWENMELALQAAKDFETSPYFADFAELADPSFSHMHHGDVIQVFQKHK